MGEWKEHVRWGGMGDRLGEWSILERFWWGRAPMEPKHLSAKSSGELKVGYTHQLHQEDGIKWFQTKYDGIILP